MIEVASKSSLSGTSTGCGPAVEPMLYWLEVAPMARDATTYLIDGKL